MNAALTLADAPAAAPLLPRVDRREADTDFLQALADGDGSIRALLLDGTLAGAVQTVAGRLYDSLGFRETARTAFAEKTDFTDTHAKREEDFLCP